MNRANCGDVRTVRIERVWPELDGGRFPMKREVGDLFEVTADILREGHEALAAVDLAPFAPHECRFRLGQFPHRDDGTPCY